MTVGDLSDPAAVEEALAGFDRIGRKAFLEKYGYGIALSWVVIKDGREYDSKAIAGAAHGYQFARHAETADPFRDTIGRVAPCAIRGDPRNAKTPAAPSHRVMALLGCIP